MALKKQSVPTDADSGGTSVEAGVQLGPPTDRANWVRYEIALECVLDSGIVVHRRLPQYDGEIDSLGSCDIASPNIDILTGLGVNLKSNDYYQDVVQRMAHSQYWFHLYGQAARLGEQVPIPMLKKICGLDAFPHDDNPQRAYNKIVGNYSGLILWYAEWSLWYTLASAPKKNQTPPQNLAQHTDGTTDPKGMQAPWSQPDDAAMPNLLPGIIR